MMFKSNSHLSQNDELLEALQTGLSEFWLKVYGSYLTELQQTWHSQIYSQNTTTQNQKLTICLELLLNKLAEEEQRLTALRNRHRIFATEIRQESDENIRHKLLLEFCRFLGGSNLRNDKKAMARWFDDTAVTERWQSIVKDHEFYVCFLMGRIATIFDHVAFSSEAESLSDYWATLHIEKQLTPWIRYGFESSVQLAAFKSLSSILKSIHLDTDTMLSPELQRYTYRFALDTNQNPELQVEALHLLAVADINKAISLIKTRLSQKEDSEQMFFKEAIAEIVCLYCLIKPEILEFTDDLISDSSALVRQSAIQILNFIDDEQKVMAIAEKLSNDKSDAVYCQLVTQLPYYIHGERILDFLLENLTASLSVLRTKALCRGLLRWFQSLSDSQIIQGTGIVKCETVLSQYIEQESNPQKQHLVTDIREKIWANSQRELDAVLSPVLKTVKEGPVSLSDEQAKAIAGTDGKRWLAANIGHRFSMQINHNKLHSGDRFHFRWWRFIYELLRPATDKRQHHSHVTGRLYVGRDFIPSATLAEVSATTVPGEPLHHELDGHWRPFLPLVDQLLSSVRILGRRQEVTLYHVAGMTRIKPPSTLFGRIKAKWALTTRFKYYAGLRNIDFNSDNTTHFTRAVRALGFTLEHNGYPAIANAAPLPASPYVARFFELAVPLSVVQFYQDFQRYFVSVYQNTIQHILVFTLALVAVFWGNHAMLSQQIKSARRQIPITIGGWGTRGKSGTERLKAALVNSQGLATISKTTGCEAMFLYSTRFGVLKEMFLFRPYDKATIWEQTFVTRLAAKLKSDVLCWECMGLTPRYIDILQQQWMHDDFVTITNCFPDHEDLQGPAGIDVPQVIARFIPDKARVWTSEENMLAYLEKEAQQKQADLTTVDWLDIATIPEDLLSRFPYQEHPANIALIAKLASEIQIPRSWAIKEMADRVVPDIGVLQTFPYSEVSGRRMRFINGMSANERYGALANWQRLQYHQSDKFFKGDFQLVTVINNRADRVPRSKVFARLIAYDFSALKHFVIGNNLDGFRMFVEEAWEERLNESFTENQSAEEFCKALDALNHFLLVPKNEAALIAEIFTAIPELNGDATTTSLESLQTSLLKLKDQSTKPEASAYYLDKIDKLKSYERIMAEVLASKTVTEEIKNKVTDYLNNTFFSKLVLVNNYYITGDQLNQLIAQSIPEGIDTDILGLQNIKGPGLDFVYSWQQWLRTEQLLQSLQDAYGEKLSVVLTELAAIPDFSCIEHEALEQQLNVLEADESLLDNEVALQLAQLQNQLQQSALDRQAEDNAPGYFAPLLNVIEEILDIFDAVRRGRQAKRILVDLATQRISLNKAASLLMQINKRQKGGWLFK